MEKQLFKKIYRAAFLGTGLVTLGSAINFFSNFIIARLWGTEAFADYSFLFSVITTGALAASLGCGQLLGLILPLQNKIEQKKTVRSLNSTLIPPYLLGSFLLTAYLYQLNYNLFEIFLVIVLFWAYGNLLIKQAIFFAREKLISFQLIDKFARNSLIFCGLISLGYFTDHRSLSDLLLIFAISYIATNIYYSHSQYSRDLSYLGLSRNNQKIDIKRGLSLYIIVLSTTMITNTDIFYLKSLGEIEELAHFAAAQKISVFGNLVILTLTNLTLPHLVRNSENDTNLKKNSQIVTLSGVLFLGIFLAFIALFGNHILGLFGKDFTQAYWTLIYLVSGMLASAFFGQTLTLMKIKKAEKSLIIYLTVALLLKIILIFPAHKYFGIEGLAITNIFVVFLWNLLCAIHLIKFYKFNPLIIRGIK